MGDDPPRTSMRMTVMFAAITIVRTTPIVSTIIHVQTTIKIVLRFHEPKAEPKWCGRRRAKTASWQNRSIRLDTNGIKRPLRRKSILKRMKTRKRNTKERKKKKK